MATVADRLDVISYMNIKPRRVLKGHQAKVLCSDWSPDKRHIVSSSQVINTIHNLFLNQSHNIFDSGWKNDYMGRIHYE